MVMSQVHLENKQKRSLCTQNLVCNCKKKQNIYLKYRTFHWSTVHHYRYLKMPNMIHIFSKGLLRIEICIRILQCNGPSEINLWSKQMVPWMPVSNEVIYYVLIWSHVLSVVMPETISALMHICLDYTNGNVFRNVPGLIARNPSG